MLYATRYDDNKDLYMYAFRPTEDTELTKEDSHAVKFWKHCRCSEDQAISISMHNQLEDD